VWLHAVWALFGVLVVGVLLLGLLGVLLALQRPVPMLSSSTHEVGYLSGQKVASPPGRLEGEGGAAPQRASTPAPGASAPPQETDSVKPSQSSPPEPQPSACEPPKGLSLREFCATAAAALCTATCAGVPQRPALPTPPFQCPPTVVEFMKKDKYFYVGAYRTAVITPFFQASIKVPVREGDAVLELAEHWGDLEPGTKLRGQYRFGEERVYGYINQAELKGGQRVDVCVVLHDKQEHMLGLRKEEGSTREKAMVYPAVKAVAVDRFE
jgi:hypothetical protein